jgi:glycosyltransferase involved in cell wall biosynthesis
MKILSLHNHYQQRGGEDESTQLEVELLRSRGHEVLEYREHNDRIAERRRFSVAAGTVWSHGSYRSVRTVIRHFQPDVVHVQNFFPLLSPSVYYSARHEDVAVVQSLRNYRILCPNGLFFRSGSVCEACRSRTIPIPGILHGCYRGSRAATAVVGAMTAAHKLAGTWSRVVDVYIALTEFARSKFVEGGIPAERMVVKPNFLEIPKRTRSGAGGYALFVGRLSAEKGVDCLIRAWSESIPFPLLIAGDGPQKEELEAIIARAGLQDRVQLIGRRSRQEVEELMLNAAFLVFPSTWYETFGRVAVEAFAHGVPVVASRLGAMAEIVEHGRTGLLFRPGDPEDLAQQLHCMASDEQKRLDMGLNARREYESKYTPETNYRMLIECYQRAMERASARKVRG